MRAAGAGGEGLSRAAWLVAVGLGLAGCAEPEGGLGRAGGAIIGGAEATGDPAVVLLVSYPEDLSTFDSCTASVIGDRVLLTAAHCLDPETHSGYSFGVFTGADASAYETAATLAPQLAPVKEVVLHPDYDREPPFLADIGVAILEEAVSIEPLPFQREALGEDVVGKPARIVGYGQAKYEEPSATRRAATTVVAALGDVDTVSVGDLERRSCIGDSGGPALVEIDGEERIVGVDSYTELSGCLEPAHYRRPDVYTGFLEVYAPAAGGGGAGGEGGAGGSGGGGDGEAESGGGCAAAGGDGGGRASWGGLAIGMLVVIGAARRLLGRGVGAGFRTRREQPGSRARARTFAPNTDVFEHRKRSEGARGGRAAGS